MLEDDVVGTFADVLRSRGAQVLAQGANQGSAFRFRLDKFTKAPDLVARVGDTLFVAEGKILSRNLFNRGARGLSDFECMKRLGDSASLQAELVREAVERIATFSNSRLPKLRVVCGVFATGHFETWRELVEESRVSAFTVNIALAKVKQTVGANIGLLGDVVP